MDFNIEIRPLAASDIFEAYDWYESQQVGLGVRFLDALADFYQRLQLHPLSFSYYEQPVRQGRLNKFPYVVVFEVVDKKVVVYSVFMAKQDPKRKRTV